MSDMLHLVEPVIPALRRYARALVRNRAAADDLVQDCLERAISHWNRRREGDPRPWLFTILHNLAVNHFRRSARRGTHITIDEANKDDFGQDAVQEQKLMYQDVLDKRAAAGRPARRAASGRGGRPVICGRSEGARHSHRHRDVAPVAGAGKIAAGNRRDCGRRAEKRGAVAEHEMSNRPITEDDLHAYVDGVLEPEREAEVAIYLEGHPDMARRVAAFSDQRDLLRKALAPIADEPVPSQLNLSGMIESRRRRSSPVWWAIAAMLMLSIGGLGGWVMRGSLQSSNGGLAALAQEAAYSYSVYAPDRVRPVEMRASDSAQLVQWVSNRLKQPVKLPDLTGSGYRLMGGRLIATSHGPAAMFMYDDDRGDRLVVLTRPMASEQSAPMAPHSGGDVSGFAWADGGMGYSLVGQAAAESLRPIANEVRKQARTI
jgi:anti-sigma factor RsiW